ncbi:TPA: glutathione S-transferase [Escherichia coli]|uniref:Glutathione S-transferase n=1 Tax=Escherichia coli TaxID=562 RepID=A0A8S7CN42_ECOLX|nr:glutathione S-transferase [Escherichia coli]EFA5286317.1 glutathione S-transferase [Escherichia coli]EFB2192629.1 glutathione S-transferase [Escherichia coli]EFB2358349.1 glutathione S-transferase [Escherichia coli]EFC1508438.1 glutathione S-transferase [Escherichia coli]
MTETTTISLMIPDCSPTLSPLVRRSESLWLQWTLVWLVFAVYH